MEIGQISDVFNVGSSKRVFKAEWTSEGVPFYRAREVVKLSKNGFVENELYISEEMFEEYSKKYGAPKVGDILVTGVGTLGICYQVKEGDRFYFKDGNIIWLKNKGSVNSDYIEYCFKSPFVIKQIQATADAAVVGTYTITNAKETKIPLPPLAEQQKIAAILDAADSLRQKDQQVIDHYTTLSQSLFLEMFGDVFQNSENFSELSFSEITEKVQIGPFGSQLHKKDYVENGIPLVNPVHIKDKKIVTNTSFTLLKSKFESLPNYHLKSGDLIMGRRGEMGRCALVTEKEAGYFCGTGSLYIRLNSKANPIFLLNVISSSSGKSYLERHAQGVTMMNLNKKIILNIKIGIPPITLQNKFAERIQTIEAQKQQAQASLKKSNDLFNSLLQRAFKGKLT